MSRDDGDLRIIPHPAFFQLLLKTKAEPKIGPYVIHA
jgi:hypothetical protein